MKGRTQKVGEATAKTGRLSALTVQGKDPDFEYSMRRKKEIEDGGGMDMYGYEPVGSANSNGEQLGAFPFPTKTKGKKQQVYLDTILCKRKKEVGDYFRQEENERYNAQVRHVQNASRKARAAIRDLDPDSVFRDDSKHSGPGVTQRHGPTEEA